MTSRPGRSCIWPTRRDLKGCTVRLSRADEDEIQIEWRAGSLGVPRAITMPRGEARMLAKRINECLDATVKR